VAIPGIEVSPCVLDFGRVFDGEEPIEKIVISNSGKESLTLRTIHSACGCAVPRVLFSNGRIVKVSPTRPRSRIGVIEPGQNAVVEVRFVTHGYHGKIDKQIKFETDHPVHPRFTVEVKAKIVKAILLNPEILDFGDVVRGKLTEKEVLLTSEGIGRFEVSGIENLPAYMSYEIREVPRSDRDEKRDHTVCLTLKLQGDFPLGKSRLILLASIIHEKIKSVRVPVRMNVKPKVVFTVKGEGVGKMLDFGVFSPAEGKSLDLDIVNLAPAIPYNVLDLRLDGAGKDYIDADLKTVRERERYLLTIRVRPGCPAGYMRGIITLVSDHPDMMVKKIRLLGYAFEAK